MNNFPVKYHEQFMKENIPTNKNDLTKINQSQ